MKTSTACISHILIKRCLAILSLCCIAVLPACEWDRHFGERPIDHPNTKWVSSEPNIWFEVPEKNDRYCPGEIEIDGETIEITVFFDYRTRMWAKTGGPNTMIFGGTCEFGEDMLTVIVYKDDPEDQHPLYHLDKSVEIITFYKEE